MRGAFYRQIKNVKVGPNSTDRSWWARYPLKKIALEISFNEIAGNKFIKKNLSHLIPEKCDSGRITLSLEISIRGREWLKGEEFTESPRLVTLLYK